MVYVVKKLMISYTCKRGFMPNSHKKSLMVCIYWISTLFSHPDLREHSTQLNQNIIFSNALLLSFHNLFNHSKKANLNKYEDLVTNTTAISKYIPTLDSGINVGPSLLIRKKIPGPTVLLEDPTFTTFRVTIRNKNDSVFWLQLPQTFDLRLFKALCLFFLLNFPGLRLIPALRLFRSVE
jgi:hypothetical protein